MMKEPAPRELRLLGIDANRSFDHGFQLGPEPSHFGAREVVGRATGVESRLIEHLVRNPIADPGREGLIEEQRLDGSRASRHEVSESPRRR